jgi:hypothetical protein
MRFGLGLGEVGVRSWEEMPFEVVEVVVAVVGVVPDVGAEEGSEGVVNGERETRLGLEEDWEVGKSVPNVPSSAKARAFPMMIIWDG